jgi:hypothetical protein
MAKFYKTLAKTQFAKSVEVGKSICNFFLADTFLVLQMPTNILPLNEHSLDTVPNTPDANCETVMRNKRSDKTKHH